MSVSVDVTIEETTPAAPGASYRVGTPERQELDAALAELRRT